MKITKIEGIGPHMADKLAKAGIRTTTGLLSAASDRQGRKSLATQIGLAESRILSWVNRADLMRVPGIGEEYSDLLEAAGVDTVRELGTRRPENLHRAILDVNGKKKLVRRIPSRMEVERWVSEARRMNPLVTY